ncbi:MAG: molecular chaperone HtpG [Alphaproteobacteria bacterium]|nr:molecular chaperone HtpG [Alphaproteobacteria bacterium]
MSEQHQFQAEVGRLLDIVTHALYTDREIFLRELVSNAADALDRLRYAAIAAPQLLESDPDLKISIAFDAQARTLAVSDNGIGMTREELANNLGTIAKSGTREALAGMGDGKKDMNLIGQFGVGFYAAFMVADKVTVSSRKAGAQEAWQWESDGKSGYALAERVKDTRGTEITLHLKDDASEFLLEDRLKQIVKKYSDHIGFTIAVSGVTVNAGSALWMRPKSDITKEQYKEFYHHVSGAMQIDEPWLTLHWRAEGAFEYTSLLFVPQMKPFDLYDPRRPHGVKLYVKRVFITEGLDGLIPPFLRFLKGVVDSEDLPLNISREMLQSSPMVAKMSSAITKKVLDALQEKAEKHPGEFFEFWSLFGPVVKEGLYDAHAHRAQLCKVARFYSTHGETLVSLDGYIGRMKEGQEHIYYLSANDPQAAKNSPQLEAFRDKGIEVLFMTDTIDEFWLPMQNDYEGRKFKSITRGAAELPKVKSESKKEEDAEREKSAAAATPLLERLKEILKDEVRDVTLSERLVDSPVCLVAPESDVDIRMQRLLKRTQDYDAKHKHILEINARHPVIRKMERLSANDELLKDTAFLLLDQAKILEGEPLKNPTEFVRRMSQAIEKGLLAG